MGSKQNKKERKALKEDIKSALDEADKWVQVALVGIRLNATEWESKSKTTSKEEAILQLKQIEESLKEKNSQYIMLIEDAIKRLE